MVVLLTIILVTVAIVTGSRSVQNYDDAGKINEKPDVDPIKPKPVIDYNSKGYLIEKTCQWPTRYFT